MEIRLVLKIKDGMDLVVLILLVLQTLISMELNVFLILLIYVDLGNSGMDNTAFFTSKSVLISHNGMELSVFQILVTALLVSMEMEISAFNSLNYVLLHLNGLVIDVLQVQIVLILLISKKEAAILICHAKVVNHGIQT